MDLTSSQKQIDNILTCIKNIFKSSTSLESTNFKSKNTSASFRIVVMADSRGHSTGINETVLQTLLEKIKGLSIQPAFILFGGDMVNGDDNVLEELEGWKGIVSQYYPINHYYPALGNHENDEDAFSRAFNYLPYGQLIGYRRTVYYFDYGNARFVILNSNHKNDKGDYIIDSDQRRWLNKVLKNNRKVHNFVMFHVPAYPIGSHYNHSLDSALARRDALWNVLDKCNVTALFVGHEHNYNRRLIDKSFNGSGYKFHNQIYQLSVGGAGAPLEPKVSDSRGVIVGALEIYHYMIIDVIGNSANFNVYDINNKKIDSFKVNK